jgi:hypothetical protein
MKDDRPIQLLLSRGRLSGAERDRILDEVLDARAERRQRRLGWLAAALVPVAVGAAAIVLVARRPPDGATAKGSTAAPILAAGCAGRAPGRCARGDRLVFEVDGATHGGLLAAYAQAASGERVWYFPTAAGHFADVPPSPGRAVVGEGVRLGAEHAPGNYTLHLFVLERPADREALAAGRARALASASLPLEIAP